ncbi:hypothetical protein BDR05DRAFT_660396 [Suillus weaverae]|nr:hypothetical protein BDR05DRAFT_660396 [Suillus weaverae]
MQNGNIWSTPLSTSTWTPRNLLQEILSLSAFELYGNFTAALIARILIRETTIEDLDLLSFSSISNSRMNPGQPTMVFLSKLSIGILLLVFGICTRQQQTRPVYRRFQITFITTTSTTQQPVCPCRLNPQPQPLVIRMPTVATTGHLDDISCRGTILPAVSHTQPSMGGTPFRLAPTTLLSDNPSFDSNLPVFAPSTPVRFTPVALNSSPTKMTSVAVPSHDGTYVTPPETPRINIPKSSQCQAPSGSISSTKGS